MKLQLGDVQETMLITVTMRATETLRKNARVKDEKAVEIIRSLDLDISKYDKFMSHEGVVARTIMFDEATKQYISKYPDAIVLNIGCGLDNRFSRVDNGKITWYNIDLEDTMAVRKHFYKDSEREKNLIASALDYDWLESIDNTKDIIVITEGVLEYFTEDNVKIVFRNLAKRFPKYIMLTELMCKAVAGMTDKHDVVKNTKAKFNWGIDDGKEVETFLDGIKLIKEESYNKEMQKYSIRGWLFGNLPKIKKLNNRLAIYEYKSLK